MAELNNEIGMPKSEELKQLIRINEKLGKLIELNVDKRDSLELICEFKQQQQDGDIKFRKGSTKTSLLGIGIALMALYISITGNDSALAQGVRELFGYGMTKL